MQFLKTNTFQGSVTTLSVYDEMYIMCISIIANFMLCNSQKLKKTVNIRWRHEQEFGAYFPAHPVQ